MNIKHFLGIALILLIVIFTVQNVSVVTINFLFWKFSISRALMIFMVFAAGIGVGIVLAGIHRHNKNKG